jgi:hypothetical protein
LKTKSVLLIGADASNFYFLLRLFYINYQAFFYLFQNALEFSKIFINPLAVVQHLFLSRMGATNCFSKASWKSTYALQDALQLYYLMPHQL